MQEKYKKIVNETRQKNSLDELERSLQKYDKYVGDDRRHEILHCKDVAEGASALVEQILSDGKAIDALAKNSEMDLNNIIETVGQGKLIKNAYLSGLFHDIALSLTLGGLKRYFSEDVFRKYMDEKSMDMVSGKALYNKGMIGDDELGAMLLLESDIQDSKKILAIRSLLNGSELSYKSRVNGQDITPVTLIGKYNPAKILDAIWYHDGNYPVRGFAEAGVILGDRLKLFEEGKITMEEITKGVSKLLIYTEFDENWINRTRSPDVGYLAKIIGKKAGPFMEELEGTETYDFIIEELASRGRGLETIKSEEFRRGVSFMYNVLENARMINEIYSMHKDDIELMQKRLEIINERYMR